MEEIYSALITGVFTLAVGCLGVYAGRRDAKSISIRQIRKEQLDNVWEPIEVLLSLNLFFDPEKAMQTIVQIVSENHKLIPREELLEIDHLRLQNHLKRESFDRLKIINSSYYNWAKKALGYPYAKNTIQIAYTPNSKRAIALMVVWHTLAFLVILFAAFILLAYIASFFEEPIGTFPDWAVEVSVYVLILFGGWFYLGAHKR